MEKEKLEHIDDFLSGNSDKLDADMLSDIDADKASDLKTYFEQQEKQVEKELKNHLLELNTNNSKRKISMYWYGGIAAAIVLGLTLIFQLGLKKGNASNELFDQFYEPYFTSTSQRGNGEVNTEGTIYYIQEDYQSASELLRLELLNDPKNSELALCLGNSYLKLGQSSNAESTFLSVIKNGEKDYLQYAKWYLALSYLKQNKLNDCKALLKEISASNMDFKSSADRLLSEIE